MTRDQISRGKKEAGPMFPSDGHAHRPLVSPLFVVSVIASMLGLAVRSRLSSTAIWLDESQTVAITQEPLSNLITALEQDGHPPAFYLMLKAWSSIFGYGLASMRSLSGLIGLGAVLSIVFVGRRIGGRELGYVSGALALTSPFLVRYGTEIRMYGLVTLLVSCWWLAIERAKDKTDTAKSWPLLLVSLLTAAMVYTHYWTMFVVIAWMISVTWKQALAKEKTLQRVFVAVSLGGLSFAAWLPSLLTQVRHTGTPWSDAPNPASILLTGVADFAGGRNRGDALMLMIALVVLGVIGFGGRSTGPHRVEIDIIGRPENRFLGWLFVGPVLVATVVITATNTAFAGRYLSIVVGFALILVAKGLIELGSVSSAIGLAGVTALSLVGAHHSVSDVRSQGQEVAAALTANASPGDVILVCPDQLGPSVSFYLGEDWTVLSYPTLADGSRVDWTDYTMRHDQASPAEVASEAIARIGNSSRIWLVWQDGYRTLGDQCAQLRDEISNSSKSIEHLVTPTEDVFEPMWLTGFQR